MFSNKKKKTSGVGNNGQESVPSSPSSTPPLSPTSLPSSSLRSSSFSPTSTPRKMRSLTDIYERCNFYVVEPDCFEEAVKEKAWRHAMNEEIEVIEKNNTWQLVDRPKDKEIIRVKWIYKLKFNSDGSVQRNKAMLVSKGYSQQLGIDYNETFAPIARIDTIRALISYAAHK